MMYGENESPHAPCRERIAELEAEVEAAKGEILRLQALVVTGKKTADGAEISFGDKVWCKGLDGIIRCISPSAPDICRYRAVGIDGPLWYSTQEAANAAGGK